MEKNSQSVRNGTLYIGEKSVPSLVERYHSPVYLADAVALRARIATFKQCFRSQAFATEITYASKAFIAPCLVRLLVREGFAIDAIGEGDLALLERSGVEGKAIVLQGNDKTDDDLARAFKEEVGTIVVDSLTELERIEEKARGLSYRPHVLIRVNPNISAHTHAYDQTATSNSKFGIGIEDERAFARVAEIARRGEVALDGFQAHIGSQITDSSSFMKEAETMLSFMARFKAKTGLAPKKLDLGGGIAIQYRPEDEAVDLAATLSSLVAFVERKKDECYPDLGILAIEPGRSLIGPVILTAYRVGMTKKTSGGTRYAFVDGGMGDNIRPALYQASYACACANRMDEKSDTLYTIAGKCCESGDILAHDVLLPSLSENDTLVTYDTGAYCYAMAMNYNGLPKGATVFIDGEKETVAIRRETAEEVYLGANYDASLD